jgi:two-component system sensor histidine kinase CpxA
MRSIFTKILLWSFGTLLVSLLAFVAISRILSDRAFRRGEPFRNPLSAQAEQARQAFESGGREQLALYLEQLYTFFPDDHHLTDADGTDVLTGENRSSLLAQARSRPGIPGFGRGGMVMAAPTADGRYRFIAVVRRRPLDLWSFVPYYLLVLLAVALLCYMLATNLATPLRVLGQTVERFGKGNLSARVNSRRQDEIGELSRAFDQMANRIQTLLTAERRLLQDISHELRSPLARLSFGVELVRTADDREGAVARLKKEIDRLTHLVGSLLQVTRVEGDPASLNREVFSLNELLRELAADGAIEADVRGCRLVVKEEEPIRVRADHELLRRAVENILRNAIRHAPEGTPIEVALDCQPSMVSVSIRDFGPGVPEEMLLSIFKPFFRVDGARNSASGGAGLGLAIAKSAIAMHGGNLSATNMQPGLLVRIELPGDLKVPTEDSAVVNVS